MVSIYNENRINIIQKLIPETHMKRYALDIGCGTGVFTNILRSKGYHVFSVDLNKRMLRIATETFGKRAMFMEMSAAKLGFQENIFDLVLALEIIEHLDKPAALLSGIHRGTKKCGKILVSTPNKLSFEGIRGKILEFTTGEKWVAWDLSHKKVFSSVEFIRLLESYFTIEKFIGYFHYIPGNNLHFLDFLKYANFDVFPLNYLGFDIIAVCSNRKAT